MNLNTIRAPSLSDCPAEAAQFLPNSASIGGAPVCVDSGNGTMVTQFSQETNPTHPTGRRTSRVWKYFRMVDNCHYVCCQCNFIGAYTNTTNMRKHIQNHHPEIFQDILDHTRPSNRLHFLRSFPPQLFPGSPNSTASYPQPFLNPGQPAILGSNTIIPNDDGFTFSNSASTIPMYNNSISSNVIGEEDSESAMFPSHPPSLVPLKEPNQFVGKNFECSQNSSHRNSTKAPNKHEPDVLGQCTAEERKLNAASSAGGSLAPGFDENSAGSGDVATGCDEVSVPLSPEQFLSEDMDHASPATPSSQRPESYKLRHNNHLTLVLESLAGDESFMDVTLTAQGKSIKAHKSVLSAVSPYFRGVLKQNPCQHPIIIMPRDMKFDELSNIISYIYKGEMTVAAEDLSSLLKTAEVLQVTGLSPSEGSSGPSSIISQMQGLPTGVFPSTSTKPSKNVAKKHSKSTAHHSQPPIEESFRASPASQVQTKVDPNEFLAADMTCVKEEIQSENEDAVDATFLPIETVETEPNPPDSRELSSNIVQVMDSPSQSLDDPTGNIQEHTNDDYPQDPLETSPSPSPTPYVCPHCLETHRPQDVLHSHLRLKHPSKPSFICSCGKVFVRHSIFIDHRKGCAF